MRFRPQISAEGRKKRTQRGLVRAVLLLMVLAAALSVVVGCTVETGTSGSTASAITTDASSQTTVVTEPRESSPPLTSSGDSLGSGDAMVSPAAFVADKLGPSVVNIAVSGTVQVSSPFGRQEQQYSGEGSGVIYTADGKIITNNHVVTDELREPVDNLEVTLATGEKLPAAIIGTDRLTDLAVIQVQADFDLPAATFRNEEPTVGEYAVALGSPLGYDNSVTLGVVSGLDRSIDGVYGDEGVALSSLIQTDAPISPGNSGGALANAAGEVIGINVAYLPAVTGAVNIGFAIPAGVVTQVADQIISTGRAAHSYIGVGTRTVTSQLQQQFGLSRASGVFVAEVTAGGPAAKAGIQQGDIIFKVDDEDMVESSDLLMAVRDKQPGEEVQVMVDREGRELTITVTLEERPTDL